MPARRPDDEPGTNGSKGDWNERRFLTLRWQSIERHKLVLLAPVDVGYMFGHRLADVGHEDQEQRNADEGVDDADQLPSCRHWKYVPVSWWNV